MSAETDKARRIVHVPRRIVAEEWGGTETVILEIARQQASRGWQPEIVTSMALAKERRDSFRGIPVRRYPHVYPYLGLTAEDRAAMDKKGGNLLSLSLFAALLQTNVLVKGQSRASLFIPVSLFLSTSDRLQW